MRHVVLTVPMLLVACGSAPPPSATPGDADAPTTPEAVPTDALTLLEERLTGAERLHVTATVLIEGAVSAGFDGELLIGRPDRVRLTFRGLWNGEDRNPWFESTPEGFGGGVDGRRFRGTSSGPPIDGWARLLTRVGLAGALGQLAQGRLPDFEAEALQLREVREVPLTDEEAQLHRVFFALDDQDGRRADVQLDLDATLGIPVERRQVQRLGDGAVVRVVERYLDVRLGEAVDEAELRPRRLTAEPEAQPPL